MKSLTLDAEHDSSGWPISAASTAAEKPYVGSLTTSSQYNRNGLAKKTLALGNLHVINYFNLDDVQQNKLARPSQSQALAGLTISPELKQAFKVANEVMGRTASTSSSPGVSLSPHSDAAVLGMHPWSLGDASMMHEDDPLLEYPRNRSLSLPALFVDASPSNHSFACKWLRAISCSACQFLMVFFSRPIQLRLILHRRSLRTRALFRHLILAQCQLWGITHIVLPPWGRRQR